MIVFTSGDLFLSRAQVLGHGVNTLGVMGAGIAVEFKRRFPKAYKRYRELCLGGGLTPGGVFLSTEQEPWILHFATQDGTQGARLEYVQRSFEKAAASLKDWGVRSLAIPAIGAGLGGLDWALVSKLLVAHFGGLDIPVFVYQHYIPNHRSYESSPS